MILEIENLEKVYDNGVRALDGISLNVERGDFFALLGPNGAGKSTTLGVISTLVRKTSGKVRVGGYDLDSHPMHVKLQLGVVPQEINISSFDTVEHNLQVQGGYYGLSHRETKKRVSKYLSLLSLEGKAKERAFTLSGGMKRRLMIARALIHEPPLLFLDEPTAGVDIEIRHDMWKLIKELNQNGTTIILTTHYLEEAESLCRNIAIINHGKVVTHSTMKDLLRKLDTTTFRFEFLDTISEEQMKDHPFQHTCIDEHTLSVDINKDTSLNQALDVFMKRNMQLQGVQPDANRLESLFVNITRAANARKGKEA